jgi:lysophospholipase L1-like esterase
MERPETVVALMTPIAPNKDYFAKGVYDLTPQERLEWANERITYIEGVIKYAKDNQIPLINVYEKSLTPQSDGDLKYINPDDYIHPSAEGADLISKTIAEFIYNNKIFPE